MTISVIDEIPNLNVEVNKREDGSFEIILTQPTKRPLGSIKPGETVTIGERDYIVLDHNEETTAIIAKRPIETMIFGWGNEYEWSDVRRFCNNDFYNELCAIVGKDNIVPHIVDLIADDGNNKNKAVSDFVSVPTTDLYRRYRELIPVTDSPYWTATRVTTYVKAYRRRVCVVNSHGILVWDNCGASTGVRPFCTIKSSVEV